MDDNYYELTVNILANILVYKMHVILESRREKCILATKSRREKCNYFIESRYKKCNQTNKSRLEKCF